MKAKKHIVVTVLVLAAIAITGLSVALGITLSNPQLLQQKPNDSDPTPAPTSAPTSGPTSAPTSAPASSLLVPVSTAAPSTSAFPRKTHPKAPVSNPKISFPFPTNKFNTYFLFSGTTTSPIITHPFTIKLNPSAPFGVTVSHSDQKESGGGTPDRVQYYFNVIYQNIGLSSTQLEPSLVTHQVESINNFGAEISLSAGGGSVRFPLLRGMAYITAIYDQMTPIIYSQHAFLTINDQSASSFTGTGTKFKVSLNNNQVWIIYALTPITLRYQNSRLEATETYKGVLRITQVPLTSAAASEAVLDAHYKRYPIRGNLEVIPNQYTIRWDTAGEDHSLLHYAHLHHQQIITNATPTVLVLPSTTKGDMKGYVGDTWIFPEPAASTITWKPPRAPDTDKVAAIQAQLEADVALDFGPGTNLASNYFAGKGLQKYALICLVADSLNRTELKTTCLTKLKAAFSLFLNNQNQNPLAYDQSWGGIIAQAGLTGTPIDDFGNSYYNDHHYHYGYFIHAAAIIAHLDPSWGTTNADWINTLIRDVNNPSSEDTYFVPFRSFDWFSGHSWSQGLFESADAKDQESTSEEINYHFGVKLWALATGNTKLSKLADLMLSANIRSINTYFLMDSSNVAHPANFIGNKVTGIFFENKADHTTWFSSRVECIHGIQMIPMLAVTEEVRKMKFITEEWELLKDAAPNISDAWASIIYTNYAFINKNDAFEKLKTLPLDDGLTRTWALYFAATRA